MRALTSHSNKDSRPLFRHTRHLCRGIQVGRDRIRSMGPASMGPRHLCRGIGNLQAHERAVLRCFNGATASLPWNPSIKPCLPIGI